MQNYRRLARKTTSPIAYVRWGDLDWPSGPWSPGGSASARRRSRQDRGGPVHAPPGGGRLRGLTEPTASALALTVSSILFLPLVNV